MTQQTSMQALLRLRRLTVDEARRDLAACVAAEAAAQEAAHRIEMTIARETAAACSLEAGDDVVDSFAAWLHQIRPAAADAAAAVEQAMLHTAEARAVLAAARAAAEAVESIIAQQDAERAAEQARREQHALDEAAGQRARRSASETGPAQD